ncbi:hypothetical protein VP01_4042g1, partial [Puccinia sorghi]
HMQVVVIYANFHDPKAVYVAVGSIYKLRLFGAVRIHITKTNLSREAWACFILREVLNGWIFSVICDLADWTLYRYFFDRKFPLLQSKSSSIGKAFFTNAEMEKHISILTTQDMPFLFQLVMGVMDKLGGEELRQRKAVSEGSSLETGEETMRSTPGDDGKCNG